MNVIALDIGGTSIKAGAVRDGVLSDTLEVSTEARLGGACVMEKALGLIGGFCRRDKFDRVGVSTTGQVDNERGVIVFANDVLPRYTGMKVRAMVEEKYRLPTAVENDVNAAAVGEARFGAGRGVPDFLCLTYGTGVGGAIVMNGGICRGSSYSAGEFGHIITHAGGETCSCGMRGCYERYASTSALVRRAAKEDPALSNGKAIFGRIGEPRVKALVDGWVEEIAYGLAGLVHVFNPSRLVLGGGVMRQKELVGWIEASVKRLVMPSFRNFTIRAAELGNDAGMLGAAYLAERLP